MQVPPSTWPQVDPTLLKAHVRAGNAHWRLGEYAAAAAEYAAACSRPGGPPEAADRLRELQAFQAAVQKVGLWVRICVCTLPAFARDARACEAETHVQFPSAMCVGSKDSPFGDRKSSQALDRLVHASQPSLQAQALLMQAFEESQAATTNHSVLKSLEEGPQRLLREAPASHPLLSLQAHSLVRLNRQASSRTATHLACALDTSITSPPIHLVHLPSSTFARAEMVYRSACIEEVSARSIHSRGDWLAD